MFDWLLPIIEAIAPGVIVGIVLAVWNRRQSIADKKESNTEKRDSLELSLLVATAELSYATTMAIKRGSPNGEVEVAVKRYDKAMEKFRDFEREQLNHID